jgi:dTDP-4-amino-4,6-dideoxygalactose transaminase
MDAVLTVLVEEKIGPGEQSQRLVQKAKENLHFDYALALRSPAIALTLALRSFGEFNDSSWRPGAVVSALSPLYYERAILDAGWMPIYCDVDVQTALISTDTFKKAIENCPHELKPYCVILHETLGFMPAHSFFDEISIPVIEDCSLSMGGRLDEATAGSFGHLSILGLEERDFLTAGGGALLFAAERRNGSVLKSFDALPPEYGLPDMNAAMALVQMREAARNSEKCAEIARLYTDAALRGGRHKLITMPHNFEYNNYAFPLILESGMKDTVAWANKKGIAVELAFGGTLAGTGVVNRGLCPAAESLALRTALFPLYPRLSADSAQKVARLIQTLP